MERSRLIWSMSISFSPFSTAFHQTSEVLLSDSWKNNTASSIKTMCSTRLLYMRVWVCTHNHTVSGLQTPQRVFSVDLIGQFTLHQHFLIRSIPHTHFDAVGLQTDTDLRDRQRDTHERLNYTLWGGKKKSISNISGGWMFSWMFTWRPLMIVFGTNMRTSTSE